MDNWHKLISGEEIGEAISYSPKSTIFSSGDKLESAYVLTEGVIEIVHPMEDGRVVMIKMLAAPTFFGAIEVPADIGHALEAVRCLTPVTVLKISRSRFSDLLKTEPMLAYEVLVDTCTTFSRTARAEAGRLFDSDQRLAGLISAYVELFGVELGQGQWRIELKRSQSDFADVLGLSHRHVKRVFSQWKNDGLLIKDSGFYIACDLRFFINLAGPLADSMVHSFTRREIIVSRLADPQS